MALIRKPAVALNVAIGNSNGAYTAGNQVGIAKEIPNAFIESGGMATLQSLVILDPAKTDASTDVLFFSQKPANGTDKAAVSISAADLANLLGHVNIPTTAYTDIGTGSVGTVSKINLKLKASKVGSNSSQSSLWVVVVTRGTPNYGAANNLALVIGLDQD